jgi:Domain of unknown function (DUF4395)
MNASKQVRLIDRNGMRGGAGISAVALLVAFAVQWAPLIPVTAVALGIGSVFGPKRSPLGALYRAGKKALKLNIPVELEEEPPPRFAQTVGFVFLGAASLFTYIGGHTGVAWTLALIVAALQGLLAATGICVGCEVYNVGRRLKTKAA